MRSLSRRGLLGGLLAAPVIIRTPGLLMRIKPLVIEPKLLVVDPTLTASQLDALAHAFIQAMTPYRFGSGKMYFESRLVGRFDDAVRLTVAEVRQQFDDRTI